MIPSHHLPPRDLSFTNEVDTYVTDSTASEDEHIPSNFHQNSNSQSPVARDRERLNRFHEEAMSFLTKAYQPTSNPSSPLPHRGRLDAFHAQAVSFLDRAYSKDQQNQQINTAQAQHDKNVLQHFHREAMSFLDAAATITPDDHQIHYQNQHDQQQQNHFVRPDKTTLRIERDKARLEQYYQDAMSFLNRTEGNRADLIEEQELEGAVVDRFQLQKYAREAMSFLDKAFREDASIMVQDEHDQIDNQDFHTQSDEDRQIAEDRAALERYEEEFGDFLSKAYQDDSTIIVDDADSETSGTDRGLYARRVANSTTSADTAYSGSANLDDDDEYTDEAYTDDEFQDPSERIAMRDRPIIPSTHSSVENSFDDGNQTVQQRMAEYEREAAHYLDGANLSDDEAEESTEEEYQGERRLHSSENLSTPGPDQWIDNHNQNHQNQISSHPSSPIQSNHLDDDLDDDDFGADRQIDDEQRVPPRDFYDADSADRDSSVSEFEAPASRFPDRVEFSNSNPDNHSERPPVQSPDPQDLTVDLIMEDNKGRSQEWSEVPLERSFYRQLPRGSTIKLRPRVSPQPLSPEHEDTTNKASDSQGDFVHQSQLLRVEKERDALMATLEEIVNERSQLAAQVSEMKSMMKNAQGDEKEVENGKKSDEREDIDLAAELKDAHATMAKLTEEMEETLALLDARYQETLKRAHIAEERCIRLESQSSKVEFELAAQGTRLSQSFAEERRLNSLLTKTEHEFEALRKKSENDIMRIEENYKEESERSLEKIRELTDEISLLQESLKAANATSVERRASASASRKAEIEVTSLRAKLAEAEELLAEEKLSSQTRTESELQRVRSKHDEEIRRFSSKMEQLSLETQKADDLKREVRQGKSESSRLSTKIVELETKVSELQKDLQESKREQMLSETEAMHMRTKLEESLKKRISQLDQTAELVELQQTLNSLRESATEREKGLHSQLEEFRSRAEQAEQAAASAENDANEAAEAAKLVQERSKVAIENERKARKVLEAEKQALAKESRAWEKFAKQQIEQQKVEAQPKPEESTSLIKSSSRRGLRKSSSRSAKDALRKKKDTRTGGAGGSEEAPKKKPSHRPRLFG